MVTSTAAFSATLRGEDVVVALAVFVLFSLDGELEIVLRRETASSEARGRLRPVEGDGSSKSWMA